MAHLYDLINACFEAGVVVAIGGDCWTAYRTKHVSGVNILSSAFLAVYSFWGIFYLWDLSQIFSCAVGAGSGLLQAIFVFQIIYYRPRRVAKFTA